MTMLEKAAESHAGHVDVVMIADDEVHRDVEGILDIVREIYIRREGEFEQSRAVFVRIRPDVLAEAAIAVQLPLANRRIGKHGDNDRRQPHAGAELRHRILFVAVVDIGLNRGGLFHHPLTESPDLEHVGRHDAITLLRYPFDLCQPADRLHSQPQKNDIQRICNF